MLSFSSVECVGTLGRRQGGVGLPAASGSRHALRGRAARRPAPTQTARVLCPVRASADGGVGGEENTGPPI